MDLKKVNVKESGSSCNFCHKGEINPSRQGLIYPYDYVYEFGRTGGGLRPCICEECLQELIKLTKSSS